MCPLNGQLWSFVSDIVSYKFITNFADLKVAELTLYLLMTSLLITDQAHNTSSESEAPAVTSWMTMMGKCVGMCGKLKFDSYSVSKNQTVQKFDFRSYGVLIETESNPTFK